LQSSVDEQCPLHKSDAKQHLTSVLMRFVWMSYSRATAFLICFLLARTSVMKTCAADF